MIPGCPLGWWYKRGMASPSASGAGLWAERTYITSVVDAGGCSPIGTRAPIPSAMSSLCLLMTHSHPRPLETCSREASTASSHPKPQLPPGSKAVPQTPKNGTSSWSFSLYGINPTSMPPQAPAKADLPQIQYNVSLNFHFTTRRSHIPRSPSVLAKGAN